MKLLKNGSAFLASKLRVVLRFMAAQGLTLVATSVYGLLCIRLLPTADYAKFVVLFGIQGTLIVLMDVGFSGTLIPLVGERVNDRKLIADYVVCLRQFSYAVYALIGLLLIACFPFLVKHQHWGSPVVSSMILILLVSTWFMRMSSTYGSVLIMLRERDTWYQGQLGSSLGTLLLLFVFWAMHWLVAFSAILINVAGIVFMGVFYFARARRFLGKSGAASPEKRRAMLRLALPNAPQSIFYALQGQIALFLITFFGHSTGVASVGALARLGQLFNLVGQMNPLFIEPYFAKLPKRKVKASYFAAVTSGVVMCLGITVLASLFPQVFLWVLGPKYYGLRFEVLLAIASSAIATLSNLLWAIHLARKFVYWWNNILTIILTFVVQFLFVIRADLTLVRTVLWMSIGTNLVALVVNAGSGAFGFARGGRDTATERPVLPVEVVQEIESAGLPLELQQDLERQ